MKVKKTLSIIVILASLSATCVALAAGGVWGKQTSIVTCSMLRKAPVLSSFLISGPVTLLLVPSTNKALDF